MKKKGYRESISDNNLDILFIANRIFFLKEAVSTKFRLPLDKLLSIKNHYEEKQQYHLINQTKKSLFEEYIPEASFDKF